MHKLCKTYDHQLIGISHPKYFLIGKEDISEKCNRKNAASYTNLYKSSCTLHSSSFNMFSKVMNRLIQIWVKILSIQGTFITTVEFLRIRFVVNYVTFS